jgi:regulator of cell morphogenesis and NO signaling
MINTSEQTLATIVTNNNNTVEVLEKHNLDFCCKGKRTLGDACAEKGLPVKAILDELEQAGITISSSMPFSKMTPEQLISYIFLHHHFYVKQAMPAIVGQLEKVVAKHGKRHPNMIEVLRLFNEINEEMTMHMQKEEVILFRRIKEISALQNAHQHRNYVAGYLEAPIQLMELEHNNAGHILQRIRELTSNYTAPAGACTTLQACITALKEFEEDFHRHIHLENNVLFPLAEKMLQQQTQRN